MASLFQLYFGAGVWPSEKTYVIAADASTGNVKWRYCNEVADPTDGEDKQFKFLPQGYLALGKDKVVVPVGRISSYYFNKADGRFLFGDRDFLAYGNPVVIDQMVFHKNFREFVAPFRTKAPGSDIGISEARNQVLGVNSSRSPYQFCRSAM